MSSGEYFVKANMFANCPKQNKKKKKIAEIVLWFKLSEKRKKSNIWNVKISKKATQEFS